MYLGTPFTLSLFLPNSILLVMGENCALIVFSIAKEGGGPPSQLQVVDVLRCTHLMRVEYSSAQLGSGRTSLRLTGGFLRANITCCNYPDSEITIQCSIIYGMGARFTLSRKYSSLKNKRHHIKGMPPNFKEMLTVLKM